MRHRDGTFRKWIFAVAMAAAAASAAASAAGAAAASGEPDAGALVCGHYRLLSVMGRGRHGVVWRAVDSRDGASVAVKAELHAAQASRTKVRVLLGRAFELICLVGWLVCAAARVCASPA